MKKNVVALFAVPAVMQPEGTAASRPRRSQGNPRMHFQHSVEGQGIKIRKVETFVAESERLMCTGGQARKMAHHGDECAGSPSAG